MLEDEGKSGAEGGEAAPAPPAIATKMAALKADLAAGKLAATLEEPAIGKPTDLPGEALTEAGKAPLAGTPPADAAAEEAAKAAAAAGAKPEGEGAPAPGAEGPEAGAEGEEPAAELVVELPLRNPGSTEEPLAIVLETKEQADRLRGAIKSGLRRDQYIAAMSDVAAQREEIASIYDEMAVDPVLFVTSRLGERFRAAAALHLLSLPGVYEAVKPQIEGWDYDEKRAQAVQKFENDRLRGEKEFTKQVAVRATSRQQATLLRQSIERMVPESLGDEDAELMRTDLLRDAAEYVEANQVANLHPKDLPRILERRLRQYSVTLQDAEAALSVEGPPPVRVPPVAGAASRPAARGAPPDAAAARQTGARLQKQIDARRAAAAVPGAGAGAPPAAPALPAKQTIKERVATLRARIGA